MRDPSLMREQNRDGGMLHDMAGHSAKEELAVMAVGVSAHDDEPGLNRTRLSEQAYACRLIGRNSRPHDAVPAQVAQQLRSIRLVFVFGSSKDFDAAAELAKKREGEMQRA